MNEGLYNLPIQSTRLVSRFSGTVHVKIPSYQYYYLFSVFQQDDNIVFGRRSLLYSSLKPRHTQIEWGGE